MVYRAHQLNMEREVAIKILPPRFLAIPDVVERFKREAQLASRLRHPNTITVHDYGQQDNYLYIVMELLRGEDLADVLKRERRVEPTRAIHIARQVLRSLGEAHEQGIVHRDLKPENIFITKLSGEGDYVKVLDFGIAKVAQPGGSRDPNMRQLTITGSTVGTPVYMSPEQAAGEDVDPLTDLYALGVILYEMLAGVPPFHDDNPVKVMRSHLFDAVPPLKAQGLHGSPLEAIIMRVLEKERSARYQDAQAFLDALDNKRPAIVAIPPGLLSPPPRPAPVLDELSEEEDEPPTLELDRELAGSRSDVITNNETSAFGAQQRKRPPIADTPPSTPRLRPPPGFLSSQPPADSIPFGAPGHQPAAPQGFQASASSTSSILTIIAPPAEPAAQEVFLLTRPKTTSLDVPVAERGSGEFLSELEGARALPQGEEMGLAPLSTMNTPAIPTRSPLLQQPNRTPGRTPQLSEWSWDTDGQAQRDAAQQADAMRTNATPQQIAAVPDTSRKRMMILAAALIIMAILVLAAVLSAR
jgi:eukaryotic-like serine/threonine-protein kinase